MRQHPRIILFFVFFASLFSGCSWTEENSVAQDGFPEFLSRELLWNQIRELLGDEVPPALNEPGPSSLHPGEESQRIEYWTLQCRSGRPRDCWLLAQALEKQAEDLGPDSPSIPGLYERACQAQFAPACLDQARRERDWEKLLPRVQKIQASCELGDPHFCFALGRLYAEGVGLDKNLDRARERFQTACDAGHPEACFDLARLLLLNPEAPESIGKAREKLEFACKNGVLEACATWGDQLLVQGEKDAARKLYARACWEGSAQACASLAMTFAQDEKTLPPIGLELLVIACQAEQAEACGFLGYAAETGQNMEKNPQMARRLYERACQGNNPLACYNLGSLLSRKDSGVPRDLQRAQEAYIQACEAGQAPACSGWGWLAESGHGEAVPDREKALLLYGRGCDGGDPWGCRQKMRLELPKPSDGS